LQLRHGRIYAVLKRLTDAYLTMVEDEFSQHCDLIFLQPIFCTAFLHGDRSLWPTTTVEAALTLTWDMLLWSTFPEAAEKIYMLVLDAVKARNSTDVTLGRQTTAYPSIRPGLQLFQRTLGDCRSPMLLTAPWHSNRATRVPL
jgi:hypothetical protein